MENSFDLITKLSLRTRRIGIGSIGENSMRTNELTQIAMNMRQTGRFARLVSFFKKSADQPRSSFHEDRLEKMIRQTRPMVDIGPMIRYR